MPSTVSEALDAAFASERRRLWGLSYRMTGSACDADDIVQETFVRALEHPPGDTTLPWRPWLTRVAVNLSRDHLRRRRRRGYAGPWLPEPVELAPEDLVPAVESSVGGISTEARYDLLESVSFAFLVALERLTPLQRAVLLLRDVFDTDIEETARTLGVSAVNVKVTLHRARRAMAGYDGRRCRVPGAGELRAAGFAAFLAALTSGDANAAAAVLRPEVQSVSDGGGQVHAARKAVVGRDRVWRFHAGLQARRAADGMAWEVRTINGQAAVVGAFDRGPAGDPRRFVLLCEVDAEGRVTTVYTVVAPEKLTRLRFPGESGAAS